MMSERAVSTFISCGTDHSGKGRDFIAGAVFFRSDAGKSGDFMIGFAMSERA